MIVSFTGAHGCGKSTLVEKMKTWDNVVTLESATRKNTSSKERRIDGVESLDETQLRVLEGVESRIPSVLEWEKNNPDKILVLDRSGLDFIAYSRCFYKRGLLSEDTLKTIEGRGSKLWDYIDIHFFLRPEFPIVDDGVRSLDEDLRKGVDEEILKQILNNSIHSYTLTGSVEDRMSTIKQVLLKQILEKSTNKYSI